LKCGLLLIYVRIGRHSWREPGLPLLRAAQWVIDRHHSVACRPSFDPLVEEMCSGVVAILKSTHA
jgi:hypothetical protein